MKLKFKGSVKLYKLDLNSGRKYNVDKGPNIWVETGKEFALDEMFDNNKWNSGLGIRAAALGDSCDSQNGQIQGPAPGVDILKGGNWNGPSEDDFMLSSEQARAAILNVTRSKQTIKAIAMFSDAEMSAFTTGSIASIREAGLFLHPTTPPAGDPQDNSAYKPYAMIARRCYYGTQGNYYVDRPYQVVLDGNPTVFEYTFELT